MGFLSHWWILGLLVVLLIFFGSSRLPAIGGAVGETIREFRSSISGSKPSKPSLSPPESKSAGVEESDGG
jgi:sec-independent protein translocase protein TatA